MSGLAMTNLGVVLHRWRINEGMTLRVAARHVGISAATFMRIEHGRGAFHTAWGNDRGDGERHADYHKRTWQVASEAIEAAIRALGRDDAEG